MKNENRFFTIGTEGRAELREKGSLFIGYAYPIQMNLGTGFWD
jgi:putative IMPACT (imprinted ancient) family translation regulator